MTMMMRTGLPSIFGFQVGYQVQMYDFSEEILIAGDIADGLRPRRKVVDEDGMAKFFVVGCLQDQHGSDICELYVVFDEDSVRVFAGEFSGKMELGSISAAKFAADATMTEGYLIMLGEMAHLIMNGGQVEPIRD